VLCSVTIRAKRLKPCREASGSGLVSLRDAINIRNLHVATPGRKPVSYHHKHIGSLNLFWSAGKSMIFREKISNQVFSHDLRDLAAVVA
jgi:hypothetical protein